MSRNKEYRLYLQGRGLSWKTVTEKKLGVIVNSHQNLRNAIAKKTNVILGYRKILSGSG